ncbi:MAG: hypothetical protein IJW18_04065 [Lachnospiraceae bacterium]|nr:hypothetical protein [Lachnospiraceae bacterium]
MSSKEGKNETGKLKRILGIAAVVAVVVFGTVLFILNFKVIRNQLKKMTASPEEYYRYVEETNKDRVGRQILAKLCDNIKATAVANSEGSTTEIDVRLGDNAKAILNYVTDTNWNILDNIQLILENNKEDELVKDELELLINGVNIVSGELIYDANDDMIYAKAPELNTESLGFNVPEIDIRELADIFDKYSDMFMPEINNVEEDSCDLEIGEIKEQCTSLKITLDNEELIGELERLLGENEGMEDKEITMILWVNNKGNILGREIAFGDIFVLRYAMTLDGREINLEVYCEVDGEVALDISGNGVIKKGVLSGEISIEGFDEKIADITVSSLDIETLKEGYIDIKAVVNLDDDILDYIRDNKIEGILSNDIKLEVLYNSGSVVMSIDLCDKDKMLCGVTFNNMAGSNEESIDIPDEFLLIDNEEQIYTWLNNIDFSTVEANWKKAGFEPGIIAGLEAALREYLTSN